MSSTYSIPSWQEFGERVAKERERKSERDRAANKRTTKLDQKEVAAELRRQYRKWSESGYKYIEEGVRPCTLEKLLQLCNYYDCSPEYLLYGRDYRHFGNKEISEATGLNDNAIEVLRKNRKQILEIMEKKKNTYNQISTIVDGQKIHVTKPPKVLDSFSWILNKLLELDDSQPDGLLRMIFLYISSGVTEKKDDTEPWTLASSGDPFTSVSRSKNDVIRAFLPNMIQEKLFSYREKVKNKRDA